MLCSMSAHPESVSRAGVAVAVPGLALTAHGIATGSAPGSAGIVLCVVLGAALAAVVARSGQRVSPIRAAVVLAVGQLVGHPAAGVGDVVGGHSAHLTGVLAWHAVAVPVSAVLLVVVARCGALITAVLTVLTSGPAAVAGGEARLFGDGWRPGLAVAGAGSAPRAPPVHR